jgi:hypothetical protein
MDDESSDAGSELVSLWQTNGPALKIERTLGFQFFVQVRQVSSRFGVIMTEKLMSLRDAPQSFTNDAAADKTREQIDLFVSEFTGAVLRALWLQEDSTTIQ